MQFHGCVQGGMFGGVPGLGGAAGGDPQQMQNLMQQMMNSPMMQVGSFCSVLWQYTLQLELMLVVVGPTFSKVQTRARTACPQAMLDNPEVLQTMLQGNPQVRQIMEANPEFGQMLNDPEMLRQSMRLAANPVSQVIFRHR